MTDNQLYKYICVKYPEVTYTEGEDLSLDSIYGNKLAKLWADKYNYPTILDISIHLDISERQIYRLTKKYNMGKRPSKQNQYG